MCRNQLVMVVSVLAILRGSPVCAADYETVWVDTGTAVDVYWNVNLSGKVFVVADINGNPACLDYWWIVWPFTQSRSWVAIAAEQRLTCPL